MMIFRTLLLSILFSFSSHAAFAQDTGLLPKYGLLQKNDMQKAADAQFLARIDEVYKGNRSKAAEDVAVRGWQFFRQGNAADAMRRFNQAWLLDNANGTALWGMAVVQAGTGKISESLALFSEAEHSKGDDIDFAVDHAKMMGIAGVRTKNEALLQDAFARFERIHQRTPEHTLNLQNWAITLFYVGNYAEAWKKLKQAEATPRHAELDPSFVSALQSKMPRP